MCTFRLLAKGLTEQPGIKREKQTGNKDRSVRSAHRRTVNEKNT